MERDERWIDVPGYEGLYLASDFGRIRSLPRRVHVVSKRNGGKVSSWSRLTKDKTIGKTNSDGYKKVTLFKAGSPPKEEYVHRLIALCFIGNPDALPFVNHKDGDKANNRVPNLEWCSLRDNNLHAWSTGLMPSKRKLTPPHGSNS